MFTFLKKILEENRKQVDDLITNLKIRVAQTNIEFSLWKIPSQQQTTTQFHRLQNTKAVVTQHSILPTPYWSIKHHPGRQPIRAKYSQTNQIAAILMFLLARLHTRHDRRRQTCFKRRRTSF